MKRLASSLTLIAAVVLISSCSTSSSNDAPKGTISSSAESEPSVSVSVKPAPEQDPGGKKPVEFDPCVRIGDDVITRAGFDSGTRERADQVHTGYAFIGCSFDRTELIMGSPHPVGSLVISSTTITLDQFRQRQDGNLEDINVNGVSAITYAGAGKGACYVVMPGPDGSIDLQLQTGAGQSDWLPCDHKQEIASTIQAALPKS